MPALWQDIQSHPRSASSFGTAWVVALAVIVGTWHDGLSTVALIALTLLPFAAGACEACWRPRPVDAAYRPCGLVAGGLVAAVDITVVFILDWEFSSTSSGAWEWGVAGLWVVITAIFAVVGAAIGMAGGLVTQTLRDPRGR